MADSFFFYDLETTSVNPRTGRVMQFAGQRTDMDLQPLGEPVNVVIRLASDVVPEPDAILVTGITPQQTLQDGVTEAEFLKLFDKEVAAPGTIFVGFNTVRFDDEFMRFMLYRNFYDAYEWQWKDGRSRWDLLDVVRMTRALRPDGIKWPVDENGKATNRLELLTDANGLDHQNAHDALSDVHASIALAKLLKDKQPKLFEYLLGMRDKKKVAALVQGGQPFVYASGKYASEYEKTTVVSMLTEHPKKQGALVYDLRFDPKQYKDYTPAQLAESWRYKKDSDEPRLPVKTLQFNRCPAVAPLGVLDEASQKRLKIDMKQIQSHAAALAAMKDFPGKLLQALKLLDVDQEKARKQQSTTADEQLYDGFISDNDRKLEVEFRMAKPETLREAATKFGDTRLQALAPLYVARNFPEILNDEERAAWEQHRNDVLLGGGTNSRLAKYFMRLQELASKPDLTENQQYLLEELQLYGQSIMPIVDDYAAEG